MTKIKILFLIGSFGTGGKERQLAELIKGLDRTKFDLYLMIKSESAHYLNEVKNKLSGIYNLERKHFGLRTIIIIRNIIKEVKPDIIHSWATPTSLYAVIMKFSFRKKFIVIDGSIRQANPSSTISSYQRILRWFINHFSDYIISNSIAGQRAYRIPIKKSYVIYNGFNFDRLAKLRPKSEVLQNYKLENSFIIGMVARFDPQKSWDIFLKIALLLVIQQENIAFMCVGDGPMLNKFKDNIPLQIRKKIVFTGKSIEVESLINAFDIAVLISNNQIHGEGISNSVMEYMSLGKAVIVNDSGGNEELINSDDVGYLIKSNEINAYINKIFELINNPNLRGFLGENAKQRIHENFSFDKMIENYTQFYSSKVI